MSADTLLEVTWPFTTPFYTGGTSLASGVGVFGDCAINGHLYVLDMDPQAKFYGAYLNNQKIAALRTQADQGIHPDESTLTRDDFWRRTFTSFHHGAGQRWSDRSTSDPFRFRTSKGVNVWTHDRLSLLPTATQQVSGATVGEMVGVYNGPLYTYLHYSDNGVWKALTLLADDSINAPTSGAITGLPSNLIGTYNTLTVNGLIAYGLGLSGSDAKVSQVNTPIGSSLFATLTTSGSASCIGSAHGRLLVGVGRKLYDVTAGGTFAAATFTLANTLVEFIAIAEGTSVIYAAAGDSSLRSPTLIYKLTYDQTTATLGAPTVAGSLPLGEAVKCLYGYLGFLFVGTDKGFRMCRQATDGTLTVGPLVPISGGVSGFSGISQFVYFTWSNFDSGSAGLGRIDITAFTDSDLVPAYASDLMAPVAGVAQSVVTLDNKSSLYVGHRPYFTVTGTGGGLYQQHATNLVSSGTLDTGLVGYGLSEMKDATYVDVRHEPLVGSITASLSSDEGAFVTIDVSNTQGSPGYFMKAGHKSASRHELRFTLARQTATTGPAQTEASLYIYPAVQRGDVWTVPLLIPDDAQMLEGGQYYYDFWAEYSYLKGLAAARNPALFQLGSQTFTVYVDDVHVTSMQRASNNPGFWTGTITTQLKNLER